MIILASTSGLIEFLEAISLGVGTIMSCQCKLLQALLPLSKSAAMLDIVVLGIVGRRPSLLLESSR